MREEKRSEDEKREGRSLFLREGVTVSARIGLRVKERSRVGGKG